MNFVWEKTEAYKAFAKFWQMQSFLLHPFLFFSIRGDLKNWR